MRIPSRTQCDHRGLGRRTEREQARSSLLFFHYEPSSPSPHVRRSHYSPWTTRIILKEPEIATSRLPLPSRVQDTHGSRTQAPPSPSLNLRFPQMSLVGISQLSEALLLFLYVTSTIPSRALNTARLKVKSCPAPLCTLVYSFPAPPKPITRRTVPKNFQRHRQCWPVCTSSRPSFSVDAYTCCALPCTTQRSQKQDCNYVSTSTRKYFHLL